MSIPMRPNNSTRIVDMTPQIRLTENECKKKLTTYEAHTIRKIVPSDPKEKSTWMRCELVKEAWSQEVITARIKRLAERKSKYKDIAEKKAALFNNQQGQITRLLDHLMATEPDPMNFEWSLVQLERKERPLKEKGHKDKRETVSITLYVKRSLTPGTNASAIYNLIERRKAEQFANMQRPPPPPQQPQMQMPIQMPIPLDPNRGGHNKPRKPRSKHYHSDSSSRSSSRTRSDSDSDYDSEYSSDTLATSISSRSGRRTKKYHKNRSHSRHREHHKQYYSTSPRGESSFRRNSLPLGIGAQPRYTHVPDAPIIQPATPVVDPFTAGYQTRKNGIEAERAFQAGENAAEAERAYQASLTQIEVDKAFQAGKIAADAERIERAAAYPERYARPPTREVVIEPARSMVSYVRPERPERYVDFRYHRSRVPEFDTRYPGRYVDDPREEDRMRYAEEHIARGARGPRLVVRPTFDDHPFAPRRASSPISTLSSGW